LKLHVSFLDRIFKRDRVAATEKRALGVDLFDEDFLRRLETLSLMSRRAAAGVRRGERRSRKKGGGVEFADHRSYVPGDDIRFLDIGVYQRFGKLLLRLFEEEEDLSLYFLIDTSASMGGNDAAKLNQALKVTAALAYVGLSGLDRVSVLGLGDKLEARMPPTRGKQRMFRVLRFLSSLRAEGGTDLGQALKAFVAQHKRRGVAVLLSDFFDPHGFEAGINVLRFNKFEPVVLQLVDARDENPELKGDLELTDVETGQAREVSMTPQIEARLRQEIVSRKERIARFCSSRGVPHFAVDVDRPFDEVVLSVLRRGGVVR
jgi:uncharacterized protein (DUF58 family)